MTTKLKEKLIYKDDEYATHQPFLWHYLKKTKKPVIELGAGYGSTPLLHLYCSKYSIPLYTLDHDFLWLSRFKGLESDFHSLIHVDVDELGWEEYINKIPSCDWGIAFIDQGNWQSRIDSARFLKDKADYILIHDFDALSAMGFGKVIKPINTTVQEEGIFDFSSEFRFSKELWAKKPWPGRSGPPTLVASMKYENLTEPEEGEIETDLDLF